MPNPLVHLRSKLGPTLSITDDRHPLRIAREDKALSLEALARRTGLARNTILRAEQGHAINHDSARILSEFFGRSPDALALRIRGQPADQTKKPTILIADNDLIVPDTEPSERLLFALEHPWSADDRTINDLERTTIALSQLEREVDDPAALLRLVHAHLTHLIDLLNGSLQPHVRKALCSLAAETAGAAGWLAWDELGPDRAGGYFRAGIEAARQSDNPALGAYLAGGLAYRPMYGETPESRLRLLSDPPHGFGIQVASPHTAAWLATMEASAHARAGNSDQYDRAMERAAKFLAMPYDGQIERPRVRFFDETYFAEERATALGQLRRAQEARDVVEKTLPNARGRFAPWLLLDLAYAYGRADEPEAAADAANRALDLAAGTGMRTAIESVTPLLDDLHRHSGSQAVQELQERIRKQRQLEWRPTSPPL